MTSELQPDPRDLLKSAPPAPVHIENSQVTIANSVSGVSQTNHAPTSTSDFEVLVSHLGGGIPRSVLPPAWSALVDDVGDWIRPESHSLDPVPAEICRRQLDAVLLVTRGLTDWLSDHLDDDRAPLVLDSLSRLAEGLVHVDPLSVVGLFRLVEPALKFHGDFSLMLRFGAISEKACRVLTKQQRTSDILELQTQATTCAHAWVYQRTGRLKDAEDILTSDEEINREGGIDRGLGFTMKCRGRLRRVMAERSDYCGAPGSRERLLDDSVADLLEAREIFGRTETAIRVPQICDVDALLARTHLVRDDLAAARKWLERSRLLQSKAQDKTFYDCEILEDELEAAEILAGIRFGQVQTRRIDQVIARTEGRSALTNEIRARAHFTKARLRGQLGIAHSEDVSAACEIYAELGDVNSEAAVRWWDIMTGVDVTEPVREMLESHAPAVRVRAYGSYVAMHGEPVLVGAVNRTRDASDQRWLVFVDEARRFVAEREGVRW